MGVATRGLALRGSGQWGARAASVLRRVVLVMLGIGVVGALVGGAEMAFGLGGCADAARVANAVLPLCCCLSFCFGHP